jgi:polysaccharide biosynthesis transport protein
MLQTTHDPSAVQREPETVSPQETLALVVGFMRRQYLVIGLVTLLGIGLGVVYLINTPPTYTAKADLMIDSRKFNLMPVQQQAVYGDFPLDTAAVDSQVEVLKSENIALSVIKNLHLMQDPEFNAPSGGLMGAIVGFISNPIGPIVNFIANRTGSSEPTSEFELTRQAVGALKGGLSVNRVGYSYVIEIAFRSGQPGLAARIANGIADAYILDQMEAKYQATQRASSWLQDRIRELRDQASAAERVVLAFKAQNNIVSTGGGEKGGRLISDQQVAELSSQLVMARAQSAEARARLDRIETVLNTDSQDATVDATVADSLHNGIVNQLRSQYLELARREADWTPRYGANHLAVVNVRNQMRGIQNSMRNELQRIAETYKSDYQIAKQREEGVQKELSQAISRSQQTGQAEIALHELESNAQTYRGLYDSFLQRYMESVQQQSFPITEARVITAATPSQSGPQTRKVLAISGFVGLILGFGIAKLRELSDRVFRTSGQIESLLQTHCIALVPLLQGAVPPAKSRRAETGADIANLKTIAAGSLHDPTRAAAAGSRSIRRRKGLFWTVVDAPFSRFAEAIRAVKVAIDLNSVVKSHRVIGLTSSLPYEGKSTLAVALAEVISQGSQTVILVDCDLRNPSLSRRLTPDAKAGVFEVLTGKISLEEVVWKDHATNMVFLPAVVSSRAVHTSDILASDATKSLFDRLRQSYDYIIVDLSPLAPVVDVRVTTHLVDSYIMVIEWGRTKIEVVKHALTAAQGVSENLLGVVLNKVDMKRFARYTGYDTGYYYNEHYSRYGYSE